MQNEVLWKRLQAHCFGSENERADFAGKLAKRYSWSKGFSRQIIEEYRRFVYLSQISTEKLRPSKTIDQVWLFHMKDVENYSKLLGVTGLENEFAHVPAITDVASTQSREQYRNTKILYQTEFGERAKKRFWPRPGSKKDRDKGKNYILVVTVLLVLAFIAMRLGFPKLRNAILVPAALAWIVGVFFWAKGDYPGSGEGGETGGN